MKRLTWGLLISFCFATPGWAAPILQCDQWTIAKLEYNAASSNLANLETTRTPEGGAYKKKMVKILGNGRCKIQSVKSFRSVYEPGHPDADQEGFVQFPDINMVEELNNLTKARDRLTNLEEKNPTLSKNRIDPDVDFD